MQISELRPGSEVLVAREYLRVSKDRHGEGTSPDQQHDENFRAVSRRGWTLHPNAYRDDGKSASRYARTSRDGYDNLISDLESDTFNADILVLWESSRGSRRVGEWITLIELCEERGVLFFVTTHGREYDPRNARDRRSLLEDAVDSEYESAKTSERIRRNVRAAAESGRPHGKNLYGYRRVYDEATRILLRIEPDPAQAAVVREAAERVLKGESFYAIAKSFNERGIPPRRPSYKKHRAHLGWTPPAVKEMLTTPAYAGKRAHNGDIVSDAIWPALLDYDVWKNKLQPLLTRGERTFPRDGSARHLLAGLAKCDVCGGNVRMGKQNQGVQKYDENGDPLPRGHYHIYICAGAPGRSGFHVAMKAEYLDRIIVEYVLARVKRPDFLVLMGGDEQEIDTERRQLMDEIESHLTYLDEVRAQAAAMRRIDLLVDQERRIHPLLEAAQRRLERLAGVDPLVLDLANSEHVHDRWEELCLDSKRRIISQLMTPRIKPVGRGRRSAKSFHDRVIPGFH